MAGNRQTVFTFLNVTKSLGDIDRARLEELRSFYAKMMNASSVTTTTTANVDDPLKQLAQKFMISDDPTNAQHLNLCVTKSSVEEVCEEFVRQYNEAYWAEKRNAKKSNIQQPISSVTKNIAAESAAQPPAASIKTEELSHVNCRILVKQNQPVVIDFIQKFLLAPLAQTASTHSKDAKSTTTTTALSSKVLVQGPLLPGSTLDVFIRSQLLARGGTIDVGRQLTKLPLIEPITLVDEFDTWHFDHLRGLFELSLVPEKKQFPRRWKLAPNAKFSLICATPEEDEDNDRENEQTSRNVDRPSTESLERFVSDVCKKENNGMAVKWLEALHKEDLFTFDHLANLKHTEWSELRQLSLNGKKILKSYVDQENEQMGRNVDRPSIVSLERFVGDVCEKENNGMAAKWLDDLRADDLFTFDHLANLKYIEWTELKVLSMNGKKILKSYVDREKQMSSDVKTTTKANKINSDGNIGGIQSESELLAYLHQIKLCFHYILADRFAEARVPSPAKLDARCVHLSFEEMRRDGFADDGLFDEMKMFFLPLTMVERDLAIDETRWHSISKIRREEQTQLMAKRQHLIDELTEKEDEYYRHDDNIQKLRRNLSLKRQVSTDNNGERYEGFPVSELFDIDRQAMEQLETVRTDLRTQIQAAEDLFDNIQQALLEHDGNSGRKNERDLIKPNRGFIMYGPPGTGKSDIMSKIATRIGVSMVAPPIAAGELNRSLVGESERIILDICLRCNRTPYLMCCVSIDEIDSLAPKRNDDSSEGSVAKLSVLLSVIDGIKDVPNLMIFCATNRLHMMDEAFLRRMSGKYFVGRPSSHARKSILSGMKSWHMPPYLLESLTRATTNFSGAALRALCRLITVHCVDAERKKSRYQLDYRTMLELADITAKQYRIFIGAETLPTLLLRAVDDNPLQVNNQQPAARFNDLPDKRNSLYTGKIVVNLNARRIDFEAVLTHSGSHEREKIVYQEDLLNSETNLQTLLERLSVYGKSRNVQLLQLIDLNLLTAESAYEEKEKFETLKERLDECKAYRRSMIVYDLDSLIGVNKSESDSSMGRSTSLSLINQNVYTYVKEEFEKAHTQPPQISQDGTPNNNNVVNEEKWSVMVIRDPFLLRQFCEDVNFTRTPSEIEEEEATIRRADERIKCVQCNDYYIEQDNKMGVCVHHDGFVYDNHSLTLAQWGQRAAVEKLLKEEAETTKRLSTTTMTPEKKEQLERDKQRFKFICCNQTVQIVGSFGGCKKGKHSLGSVTMNEWEYACDHVKEYQDKRLNLLDSRIQQ